MFLFLFLNRMAFTTIGIIDSVIQTADSVDVAILLWNLNCQHDTHTNAIMSARLTTMTTTPHCTYACVQDARIVRHKTLKWSGAFLYNRIMTCFHFDISNWRLVLSITINKTRNVFKCVQQSKYEQNRSIETKSVSIG